MNQPSLLQRYAARGIHFEPIGAQVRFVAIGQVFDAAAIDELRSQISRLRLELLEKLRDTRLGDLGPNSKWWTGELQEAFNERAGVLQFDGGHSRVDAEAIAEIELRQSLAARGAQ